MSANMHSTSSWTRPFPLVGIILLAALVVGYLAIGSMPAIQSNPESGGERQLRSGAVGGSGPLQRHGRTLRSCSAVLRSGQPLG